METHWIWPTRIENKQTTRGGIFCLINKTQEIVSYLVCVFAKIWHLTLAFPIFDIRKANKDDKLLPFWFISFSSLFNPRTYKVGWMLPHGIFSQLWKEELFIWSLPNILIWQLFASSFWHCHGNREMTLMACRNFRHIIIRCNDNLSSFPKQHYIIRTFYNSIVVLE